VLGPLLFLLYINDLTENVRGAKLVSFADDTNLLITGSDEVGLQHKIKNVMRELEVWFEKNNLIINSEKTFAVLFHPKQKRVPLRPQINFKTMEITYQSELRFLGIYITENLKWDAHTRVLRAKLCEVVYMIKTIKETMSPYMIRSIYFSNFESCLRYSVILWGGHNDCDKLFKLQKKVLRIISGVNNRTSCL
jgi:hypothetical protein